MHLEGRISIGWYFLEEIKNYLGNMQKFLGQEAIHHSLCLQILLLMLISENRIIIINASSYVFSSRKV